MKCPLCDKTYPVSTHDLAVHVLAEHCNWQGSSVYHEMSVVCPCGAEFDLHLPAGTIWEQYEQHLLDNGYLEDNCQEHFLLAAMKNT